MDRGACLPRSTTPSVRAHSPSRLSPDCCPTSAGKADDATTTWCGVPEVSFLIPGSCIARKAAKWVLVGGTSPNPRPYARCAAEDRGP